MATYTTLRIDATSGAALRRTNWTLVGTADAGAAVKDGSDATYLEQPAGAAWVESICDYAMLDPVIPAGAKIYGVRSTVRVTETTNQPFSAVPQNWIGIGQRVDVGTRIYVAYDYVNAHPAAPTSYSFGWRTQKPSGGEWTVADLNALIMPLDVYQQAANLTWRVYEAYLEVGYNQQPTVTVTAPAEGGTITDTTRPAVTWTFSDPDGDPQEAWRVKIFSSTQYGAVGFDPETSAATYDSGKVYSSATSHTPTVDLASGTTYRAYVKAWQPWQYEFASAWDYNQFTVTLDLPGVPAVTATADAANARVQVVTQGAENLLTTNQASIETDTTGWSAGSNTTIIRTTSQAAHGVASLRMDSVAAGDIAAFSLRPAVTAGQVYTAVASFRSAVIPRSARVSIDWYTAVSGGSLVSQSFGSTITTITTGWTQATLTATAPAGAQAAVVLVRVLGTSGAGEVHYADKISLAPGTSTVWARGGLSAGTTFLVEYSDDGGTTWTTHPRLGGAHSGATTQTLTQYDYESPSGVTRRYRARSSYTGPPQIVSDPSAAALAAVTLARWWLKDPTVPSLNMTLRLAETALELSSEEVQGVFYALGRSTPVVVSDATHLDRLPLALAFLGPTDYAAFEALRNTRRTLLLQAPAGDQWYIRLGAERKTALLNAVSGLTGARTVAVDAVTVDRP